MELCLVCGITAMDVICNSLPFIEELLIEELGEDTAMEIMRQIIIQCRLWN